VEEEQEQQAEFLDAACREALAAIRGNEAAKKRATVLLLAIAEATMQPLSNVFRDPRACNKRVWYQKWQKIPEIAAALELLTARALAWRDAETARIEAQAAQQRNRALALGSLDAVQGLRDIALDAEQPAKDRIEADAMLLALADEQAAARIVTLRKGTPLPVEVEGLDALIDYELARMASGSESCDAETAAGTPGADAGAIGPTSGGG
jgi:hypothetical protein